MVQQLYRSYPFWKSYIGAMSDSLEIIAESKDIIMDKFMEIEVARKTGAPKQSHSQTRTGYRCGYRVRCFDTSRAGMLAKRSVDTED